MTRQEALECLSEGKRIRHNKFTEKEFIQIADSVFVDEEDNTLDWDYFWSDRSSSEWQTGWEVVGEKKLQGYRLKQEFLHLKNEAALIGRYNRSFDIQKFLLSDDEELNNLRNAAVLDIWFEPVYSTYSVGDYVKLHNKRGVYWNSTGLMDKFKGEIVKITGTSKDRYWIADEDKDPDSSYAWTIVADDIERRATQEEIDVLTELPIINGHKGKITTDGNLLYGCALLHKEWFTKSKNRGISAITLDSGVRIEEAQIERIRKYLKAN